MDIEFENKFYTNDEMLKEYVNKVLSKYVKRIQDELLDDFDKINFYDLVENNASLQI